MWTHPDARVDTVRPSDFNKAENLQVIRFVADRREKIKFGFLAMVQNKDKIQPKTGFWLVNFLISPAIGEKLILDPASSVLCDSLRQFQHIFFLDK